MTATRSGEGDEGENEKDQGKDKERKADDDTEPGSDYISITSSIYGSDYD